MYIIRAPVCLFVDIVFHTPPGRRPPAFGACISIEFRNTIRRHHTAAVPASRTRTRRRVRVRRRWLCDFSPVLFAIVRVCVCVCIGNVPPALAHALPADVRYNERDYARAPMKFDPCNRSTTDAVCVYRIGGTTPVTRTLARTLASTERQLLRSIWQ